jgi:hypothetical protein
LKKTLNQLFEEQKSVHVLYAYNGMMSYVEQAVEYIKNSVTVGDYVIFIENERIYPMIHNKLKALLTKEQMKLVHYVNNFDFYFSSGSYHPPAITDYFNKMVQPYVENKISFRSWAHVQWATMEEPLHLIRDFENIVDQAVNSLSFPLICAYEREKMPDHLKTILMETHPYILIEDDFIVSEQYKPLLDLK